MKSEKIFINCSIENRKLAEQIRDVLLKQGIPVYLPPEQLNADGMVEIVEKIEQIAHDEGIMLAILSDNAIKEDLFINNFQYICEVAGERRVLLIYRMGEIKDDSSIALYDSQSVMVRAAKEDAPAFSTLVMQARRLLKMEKNHSLIPKRMEKRTVRRLFIIAAIVAFILGISWYFIRSRQTQTSETALVVPTPIAVQVPLDTENIDQEMMVQKESRSFDFEVQGDPASEAPFSFQPAVIQKTISFDDSQYDLSGNSGDITTSGTGAVDYGERMELLQKDGILQVSYKVPESNVNRDGFNLHIRHLFALVDTSYVGMRFRMADYEGWADAEQPSTVMINLCSQKTGCRKVIEFDLVQQQALIDDGEEHVQDLGSTWHTVEMVLDQEGNKLNIFVDGSYVRSETNLPTSYEYDYMEMIFPFYTAVDWVDFYIDEIVYGGEQALQFANSPEEALFHFEPDELLFVEDFNARPSTISLREGEDSVEMMDGVLAFEIPVENSSGTVSLNVQSILLSQTNYYALRYKLDDNGPEYWSGWGSLEMLFIPSKNEIERRYFSVDVERYTANFSIFNALQDEMIFIEGSNDNSPFGLWHTLEMVLLHSPDNPTQTVIQVWHDGYLVVEEPVDLAGINAETEEAYWRIVLYTGSDSLHPFSGQIDLIRSGHISMGNDNE